MMIEHGNLSPNGETGPFLELMLNRSFQHEIAQVRTQALLLRIAGDIPDYRWSYSPTRVQRNATGATIDLQEVVARTHLNGDEQHLAAALRLAQLWESLADLQDETSRDHALASAAIAYEIAGYQANSSYIAKQLVPDVGEINEPTLFEL